ncbi:MAG TPA: nitronate monooxygenase, partial [Novosphingobium sp.]|nr:nitronate monooxygenase [Novosphingobium sp.]
CHRPNMWEAGLNCPTVQGPPRHNTDHLLPGKRPWRDVWSGGQGVALIDDVPGVAQLVRRLQGEYLEACAVPDMAAAARAALENG